MKINVVERRNIYKPECTACGFRFPTETAKNSYRAMCAIALGQYKFCPVCGSRYEGCQIRGIDFEKCDKDLQDWLNRGNEDKESRYV